MVYALPIREPSADCEVVVSVAGSTAWVELVVYFGERSAPEVAGAGVSAEPFLKVPVVPQRAGEAVLFQESLPEVKPRGQVLGGVPVGLVSEKRS